MAMNRRDIWAFVTFCLSQNVFNRVLVNCPMDKPDSAWFVHVDMMEGAEKIFRTYGSGGA